MASILSNYDDDHYQDDRSNKRKKRRRLDTDPSSNSTSNSTSNNNSNNHNQIRWRTLSEQHLYSSKLLDALRHVRRRNTASSPPLSGGRAVRDAADKTLAIAARGRSRWSRAILSNRMKLRLKHHKKAAKIRSKTAPPVTGNNRLIGSQTKVALPGVDKKVKVLSRLVPGCRKLSFPNLLEETTDYIAALQMQVRAMAALADLLTGSSSSTSSNNNNNDSNNNNNPV